MIDRIKTDVLVLGLGPAGASAAARASELGLDVIALDRKFAPGVPVQCAELVPALIGQAVDLKSTALRQTISRMVTYVEEDDPDTQDRFPGHMLDRAEFDRLRVEGAIAAGADCRNGVAVSRVAPDGVVTTRHGAVIHARVIIGADGPRSRVGRAIRQINAELIYARQARVSLKHPHDATDIFLSARIPGGYGWLFPSGDLANVGVGVEAGSRHCLKDLLRALCSRLADEGRIVDRVVVETGGAIPAGGMLEPYGWLGERLVVLAGDAAGLTNPVTGAGIHAALVSGALAGECAAAWIAGAREAPVEYEDELRDIFGRSLARALARRRDMLKCFTRETPPSRQVLRNGWIAYPGYWRDHQALATATPESHR